MPSRSLFGRAGQAFELRQRGVAGHAAGKLSGRVHIDVDSSVAEG